MTEGVPKKKVKKEAVPMPEVMKEAPISPETIEKIMQKVQDINAEGTAFSAILSRNKYKLLSSILQNGLLGVEFGNEATEPGGKPIVTKESWKRKLRKDKKDSVVFANILGKSQKDYDGTSLKSIRESWYMRYRGYDHLGIIFNPASFKENESGPYPERDLETNLRKEFRQPRKSFTADLHGAIEISKPYHEEGYLFSRRIPPRFFTGLVFAVADRIFSKEIGKEVPLDPYRVKIRQETVVADLIAQENTINSERLDCLIPIYDLDGNLWWPKQMSYEEVKKFVAERDAKKEGGEMKKSES